MGVQLDIIIPPIIVAILIIVIFRMNAFMMETSIDNHLNKDVQTLAEVAAVIIQEEMRTLKDTLKVNSDSLHFTRLDEGNTLITRDDKSIKIIREIPSFSPDTLLYPLNLTNLNFSFVSNLLTNSNYLRYTIETESRPEQHARFREGSDTVKAFADRRILLKNMTWPHVHEDEESVE